MHEVVISLAANRFQKRNLSKARSRLALLLHEPRYSSEMWTTPMGSHKRADVYLNQLVGATTQLSLGELTEQLKSIELAFGRNDAKRQLGIVPIDLDVLLYDGERLHLADWERPYTQTLIKEL